jgi:hypothetical protein
MQLLGSCIGPTAVIERFLEAKITAEETLLAKLVALPHQHALLVLRQCLQQNLRHLQRSLHSDDLQHLWERLDASQANSRAQDPRCGICGTVSGRRQRPHLPPCQTRRPGHLIILNMRPSRVCSHLRGFRHPSSTLTQPTKQSYRSGNGARRVS